MALKTTQNQLKRQFKEEKTILKDAIYLKCYECSAFQGDGYFDCQIKSCPLYDFRLTSNIARTSKRLQKKARQLKKAVRG